MTIQHEALIERAREATTTLRDAVREGRRIDFRERDTLVLAIHDALDAGAAALSRQREQDDDARSDQPQPGSITADQRVGDRDGLGRTDERGETGSTLFAPPTRTPKELVPAEGDSTTAPPCGMCHGPYQFDTTIPSVVWNRVVRAAGLPEYLCLTCVVKVFAEAGESFTAELWGATFNGLPIEVQVNGQNAKDAALISEENTRLRAVQQSAALSPPSRQLVEQATERLIGAEINYAKRYAHSRTDVSWPEVAKELSDARGALIQQAALVPQGWQPIEALRKDQIYDLWVPMAEMEAHAGRLPNCSYSEPLASWVYRWGPEYHHFSKVNPSHGMPLPAPPLSPDPPQEPRS